jgi:hypothetical protein
MSKNPIITNSSWGVTEVDGHPYKDVRLYPGGVETWNWKEGKEETHTSHASGIQIKDVKYLIDHGITHLVLSIGRCNKLAINSKTTEYLKTQKDLEIIILETSKAIEEYNNLVNQGVAVGALIHSTC